MEHFKRIFALQFVTALQQRGGEVFLVGGCVRDHFQGKDPKDIDLIVRGIPVAELQHTLEQHGHVDLVGESFGVFKFIAKETGEDFDIALPRTDSKIEGAKGHKSILTQSDHNLPIEADLARRDFTINAFAIDKDLNIIDPFEGQEDLYKGIIRCITADTFVDDPLRLKRAVVFAARFNFEISEETFDLIASNRTLIKEIVPERILDEIKKVFDKGGSIVYLAELLDKTGLFAEYFGFNIKHERLGPVQHLAEFLFFAIADGTFMVSDFYKKKMGSAMPQQLFKEIRAFDTLYNSPDVDSFDNHRRKAFMSMFEAIKQSDIVLRSNFIQDHLTIPFLTGEFPKTRKELALTGDDLVELGFPEGKIHGIIIQECLDSIFEGSLKNDKTQLLTLLPKHTK